MGKRRGVGTMLRIYLFGPVEVDPGTGEATRVRKGKAAELLAYLWLHREQPQPRPQLAGLLWPETGERQARQSLRTALYQLRQALEPEGAEGTYLLTERETVQFSPEAPCWVDVEAFERRIQAPTETAADRVAQLEAAVELYRGDLVAGCYEDWCLVERDRLRSLYLSSLRELLKAYHEQGELEGQIACATRILRLSPLQEEVHRHLIQAYHAQGDRSAALAQYRECEQRLHEELGVEPAPETQALYEAIASGSEPRTGDGQPAQPSEPQEADRPSAQPRAVAVLPFINMSPETENEPFCDGLTEELINALAQVEGLRVAAQTSVFQFKRQADDVREIGRRLDVDAILEGSVRRTGEQLRVNALLVEVASGHHRWSEQFDRELADIFALQEELAQAIVGALQGRLLGEAAPLIERPTENLEAYVRYLRGRYFWRQRTDAGLRKAIEAFEGAIAADPDYARAYAGLADAYNALGYYHFSYPEESFPRAERAAETALELDDRLAEAHASLGLARDYAWDWAGAEQAYRRAIALRPDDARARHWHALFLMNMGHLESALEEIGSALEVDPYALPIHRDWGLVRYAARQPQRAREQLQSTIAMAPEFSYAHLYLGMAHLEGSANEEALAAFEAEAEISGDRDCLADALIACARARMGEGQRAREALRRAADASRDRYISPYFLGLGWLELGEDDRAFEAFEEAYERHDFFLSRLQVEPMLDEVRADPRYRDLVARLGLAP